MKSLKIFAFLMVSFAVPPMASAEGLIGSKWIGEAKLSVNGKLKCSGDPKDNPEERPTGFTPIGGMTPFLRIDKISNEWFRIVESDNCGGVFGFDGGTGEDYTQGNPQKLVDGYAFARRGNTIFDKLGNIVGSISPDGQKMEIRGGGSGETKFIFISMEVQADGKMKFYAKFKTAVVYPQFPLGAVLEHSAIYAPRDIRAPQDLL